MLNFHFVVSSIHPVHQSQCVFVPTPHVNIDAGGKVGSQNKNVLTSGSTTELVHIKTCYSYNILYLHYM